ncbi:MAG: hypothetical protein FJ145_18470 [Deltaproteobacteria bacterium]|nr:hypothetical protein [Deltaproteobacteria bacterium]
MAPRTQTQSTRICYGDFWQFRRTAKSAVRISTCCSYHPFATITPGKLKEELGHVGHGLNMTLELLAQRDDSRIALQEALERWYPKALNMFGRYDRRGISTGD